MNMPVFNFLQTQQTTQTVLSRAAGEFAVHRRPSYTCHPSGFPVHWKPSAHQHNTKVGSIQTTLNKATWEHLGL